MKLRGAMLYVKDLERMKRFYAEVLGVEATNQDCTNAWVVFRAGGDVGFALHAIPAGIAENIEIACPPVPREQEAVKLIFEVKDVEGERERLELLGVQTLLRPWQEPIEACDVIDPEGNIFQLCSSGADTLLSSAAVILQIVGEIPISALSNILGSIIAKLLSKRSD